MYFINISSENTITNYIISNYKYWLYNLLKNILLQDIKDKNSD